MADVTNAMARARQFIEHRRAVDEDVVSSARHDEVLPVAH